MLVKKIILAFLSLRGKLTLLVRVALSAHAAMGRGTHILKSTVDNTFIYAQDAASHGARRQS